MNCKKCGEKNVPGAKFCNNCGGSLEQAKVEKDIDKKAAENRNPAANDNLPLGKNKPQVIIFSMLGVLITAVIILVLILAKADNIEGKWYNPSLEQAIEFRDDNEVILYTTSGAYLGTYTYDWKNGSGTIVLGGESSNFDADDNSVTVHDGSGMSHEYLKMDDDLDIESMVNLKDSSAESSDDTTATPQSQENTPEIAEATPTNTPQPTDTPFVPTPTVIITPPPTATPTATPFIIITPTPTGLTFATLFPVIIYSPIGDIEGTWEAQATNDHGTYTFYNTYDCRYYSGGNSPYVMFGTFTYDDAADTGEIEGMYLNPISFEYNEALDVIYIDGTKVYVRQP